MEQHPPPRPAANAPQNATRSVGKAQSALARSAEPPTPTNHDAENSCSARERDQFYTLDKVAKKLVKCAEKECAAIGIHFSKCDFLEPSAGEGAFLKILPLGTLAYDIEPKALGIIKADFLLVTLPKVKNLIVIGNPPFGKNASLAVKFFNHAATAAQVIAFIVPRSFQKQSIQNRLHSNFHLLAEIEIESDAFIFEGRAKHVPTVFQIWVKRKWQRPKIQLPVTHSDFDFTTPSDADFAIQRVGAKVGRVHRDFSRSPNSHYFIKAKVRGVMETMMQLNFEDTARKTAGPSSLARTELVQLYCQSVLKQKRGRVICFTLGLIETLFCVCRHLIKRNALRIAFRFAPLSRH